MSAEVESEAPVVVARFTNLIDAEVLRSMLVGAGIACELSNAHFVGVLPHLSNAVGGVEVLVRPGDAEVARRLMEGQSEAVDAPAEPEGEPDPLPSARDAQATRAFRCAVLALFLLPVVLNLYSVWLLLRLGRVPGELSERGRRHVVLAVIFNLMLGWIPAAVFLGGR